MVLHKNLFTAEETPGPMLDTYIFENGDPDRGSFIVEVKNTPGISSIKCWAWSGDPTPNTAAEKRPLGQRSSRAADNAARE